RLTPTYAACQAFSRRLFAFSVRERARGGSETRREIDFAPRKRPGTPRKRGISAGGPSHGARRRGAEGTGARRPGPAPARAPTRPGLPHPRSAHLVHPAVTRVTPTVHRPWRASGSWLPLVNVAGYHGYSSSSACADRA